MWSTLWAWTRFLFSDFGSVFSFLQKKKETNKKNYWIFFFFSVFLIYSDVNLTCNFFFCFPFLSYHYYYYFVFYILTDCGTLDVQNEGVWKRNKTESCMLSIVVQNALKKKQLQAVKAFFFDKNCIKILFISLLCFSWLYIFLLIIGLGSFINAKILSDL